MLPEDSVISCHFTTTATAEQDLGVALCFRLFNSWFKQTTWPRSRKIRIRVTAISFANVAPYIVLQTRCSCYVGLPRGCTRHDTEMGSSPCLLNRRLCVPESRSMANSWPFLPCRISSLASHPNPCPGYRSVTLTPPRGCILATSHRFLGISLAQVNVSSKTLPWTDTREPCREGKCHGLVGQEFLSNDYP